MKKMSSNSLIFERIAAIKEFNTSSWEVVGKDIQARKVRLKISLVVSVLSSIVKMKEAAKHVFDKTVLYLVLFARNEAIALFKQLKVVTENDGFLFNLRDSILKEINYFDEPYQQFVALNEDIPEVISEPELNTQLRSFFFTTSKAELGSKRSASLEVSRLQVLLLLLLDFDKLSAQYLSPFADIQSQGFLKLVDEMSTLDLNKLKLRLL